MKYNPTGGFNDYNAHRPHISCPIKSHKYLKETQVEACPALHHGVRSGALKNPKALFVYKPLIMLMTLCCRTGHFSIDHRNKDQNKVTTLRIFACARLKEMKEMWDSTFKLPIYQGRRQRESMPLSSLSPQCLCGNINMHIYAYKSALLNNLFKR